jgi:hypothetical protein
VTVKPITKAVLYALAVQRYGPNAWTWPLWMGHAGQLVVAPGNPPKDWKP